MFRVKICGITRETDAHAAIDAGADAIGLNFYEKSSRYLSIEQASQIAGTIDPAVLRVGVFVNASASAITAAVRSGAINAIQLHGDESFDLLSELPSSVPVIRAVRFGDHGLQPATQWIEQAIALDRPLQAILVDAAGSPGEYGGTGRTADWDRLAKERHLLGKIPMILAGGLSKENVAEGLTATGAVGVDTASGVEVSPGVKDPLQMQQFVAEALSGLSTRD